MNRRRLEAEEIRDALLAVSGRLDDAMGGTLLATKNHTYVTSTASANDVELRRSTAARSTCRWSAAPSTTCSRPSTSPIPARCNGKRPSTTVAPQALFMMNSPLVLRQTARHGRAACSAAPTRTTPAASTLAYRARLRPPADAERSRAGIAVRRPTIERDLAAQDVDAGRSAAARLAGAVPRDAVVERVHLRRISTGSTT